MLRSVTANEKAPPSPGFRPELSFLIRFVVVAGTLCGLYAFPYSTDGWVYGGLSAYLAAYAHAAGAVLHLFDSAVRVSGANIAGRFSLRIVKDCDAMDVNILLVAAVIAFPASWAERARGLAVGLVVILAANIARICLLYFVGVSAPNAFEFAHRDLFPLLLVVIVAGTFLLWSSRVTAKRGEWVVNVAL